MFLSPNTLYLAVWNVAHGEEGVETLRKWLLNIQVGRQASISLIIGSFSRQHSMNDPRIASCVHWRQYDLIAIILI